METRGVRPGIERRALALLCLVVLFTKDARAQDARAEALAALRAEIAAVRAESERRLAELEEKLRALEEESVAEPAEELTAEQVAADLGLPPPAADEPPPAVEPPPESPPGPEEPTPPPAPSQASNYFNPAIALIGNLVAVAGDENPVEESPAIELRESELSLQAAIDPYARADVFLAFGSEGVEVEEGFVTFTALPANLLLRAGKMRIGFGKTNPLHPHVRPWVDTPLPIVNLLGGDEGWGGTGISAAMLIPLPGDTFSEATLQVLDGEAEGLFEPDSRSDLSYAARYRVFRDLTEATNLDVGASWGQGRNGTEEGADTTLQGFDVTLRWKPLQTALYRSFVLRGEAIRSQREQPGGTEDAFGWFVSADGQLARRWFLGGRYESAEHADAAALRDTGESLAVTFKPSEFSLLRGQLRRRRFAELGTADELLLQLQFAIGAHGAHPF